MADLDAARDRLITAALRVAVAERGGADGRGVAKELENASATFDEAVGAYSAAVNAELDGVDRGG